MADAVTIRAVREDEVPQVLMFIRELAKYERLEHEVVATEERLRKALFGEPRYCEVVFACLDDEPVGFALFFSNFSTFLGLHGIYLEDLFVGPEARGMGAGRALIEAVYRAADEAKADQVYWLTAQSNATARRLYDRVGQATPFMKYRR